MNFTSPRCETYHEGESIAKNSDRNPEKIEIFVDCNTCSVQGMLHDNYDNDYDIKTKGTFYT